MAKWAIYLTDGDNLDAALERGVTEAGCRVDSARSVSEVIQWLRLRGVLPANGLKALHPSDYSGTNTNGNTIILVASVKGGAIPLLTLLREQGYEPPPTLVFDEDGSDVHTIVRALQLGVREYVLASDPEIQRALCARLLVERVSADHIEPLAAQDSVPSKPAQSTGFEWDPIGRVIHIGEEYVRLSSVEGRIFHMLYQNRNHTVQVSELVPHVLIHQNLEISIGARRLRPHIMRLRRKLEHYPELEMRIVNMRGTGYMLI
ncbi:MAG TPA: winged helix-turn-helix domain-containing protein [Anaerolineae bacterium]|jgi:DNA-binding response OmpR family regulator